MEIPKEVDPKKAKRYLPNGELNIAARWSSPGIFMFIRFIIIHLKKINNNYFNLLDSGPALYALPSTIGFKKHDFTLVRNPAFTISKKLPELSKISFIRLEFNFN
jgi:hypothetical protein